MTAFCKKSVLVHVSHAPLVLTFVGEAEANVGTMLYFAPLLRAALDSIKVAVQSIDSQG